MWHDAAVADHYRDLIRRAAAEFLDHIDDVLTPGQADIFRTRLIIALRKQDTTSELEQLLDSNSAAREWLSEYIEGGVTFNDDIATRSVQPPGRIQSVRPIPWKCPQCDFLHLQRFAGESLPDCPTHHRPLKRAS